MSQESANSAADPAVNAALTSGGTVPVSDAPAAVDPRLEGVMNFLAGMGIALQRHEQAIEGERRSQSLVEQFVKLNPTKFEGIGKSKEAEKWIWQMEKIFAVLECDDSKKMMLAEYQLQDNAMYWWRAFKPTVFPKGLEVVWSTFVVAFYDQYFSDAARDEKMVEFMNLKQGDMAVREYEAKLSELSRFAPLLVGSEADRAKWFLKGINGEIRRHLISSGTLSYSEMHKRALLLEKDMKREAEESRGQGSHGDGSRGKRPMQFGKKSFELSKRQFG